MPDDEEGNLPAVLPLEEANAAASKSDVEDYGALNNKLEQALSGHTIKAAELRNQLAQAHIKNVKADRNMRKTYAGRILAYLELYSGGVFILLLLSGFKVKGFSLEPGILAALVGSTALAAIGLVGFIARGLFRAPPPGPGSEPRPEA